MIVNRNHFITPRAREALVSLTAVSFIEEHGLLGAAQLDDARQSLQALCLRARGEESALRSLIAVLETTRQVRGSFARISGTLAGVFKCFALIESKLAALRAELGRKPVAAEAHAAFIAPFLSFSHEFLQKTAAFADSLSQYLAACEQEARAQDLHRVTLDARERRRRRRNGHLAGTRDDVEAWIDDEVAASFDHDEAEVGLQHARYQARTAEQAVTNHLQEIHSLCLHARNPAAGGQEAVAAPEADVCARFAQALEAHACLEPLKERVLELLKLYRHSYGLFQLDYRKLKRALGTLMDSPDVYFQWKVEDRDPAVERNKLRKIEALIPFLEQAARLAADEHMDAYPTFTRELSAAIRGRRAPWHGIAEDLLRAKVQAEAQISERL